LGALTTFLFLLTSALRLMADHNRIKR